MGMEDVRKSLCRLFLNTMNEECNVLCQRTQKSVFRKMSMAQVMDFQWCLLADEMKSKALLLFSLLLPLVMITRTLPRLERPIIMESAWQQQ